VIKIKTGGFFNKSRQLGEEKPEEELMGKLFGSLIIIVSSF